MSVTFTAELGDDSVNMSNANAARVLAALGHSELCGDEGADAFLGRVLLALAIEPEDCGRPSLTEGRYIDCGRPEGYTGKRLRELHALAECALRRGKRVTWG
ncbi:hypothetical protein AB0D13_42010 [Streptomyces sp. NPDC048430]|uniref:hypothetical protein n=1 Tax=Streptomyces sp. NPDC048430 TaxID=3155388 RepID=UPI003422AEEB